MKRNSLRLHLSLLLACLASTLCACRSDGRTWTSKSGATVEADFVKEEFGYVVLERADGGRIKIQSAYLVEEDREHIRDLKSGQGEGEKQLSEEEIANLFGVRPGNTDGASKAVAGDAGDGGQAGAPPAEGAGGESVQKSFLDRVEYAEALKITREEFKGINLEHPDKPLFIGLQYGPRSEDVLFVAFDRESAADLPRTAFVYDAGAEGGIKNAYDLKGRRGSEDYDKKQYRVARFDGIEVEADYGEVRLRAEIEFYVGMLNVGNVYMLADVEMVEKGAREGIEFYLWGPISGGEGVVDKKIGSTPLLGSLGIDFSIAYKKVFGLVKVNGFEFAPGKMPNEKMLIVVKNEQGEQLEDEEVDWDEDIFFADRFYGKSLWYVPGKLDEPGKYIIECSMDLGPLLGHVKDGKDYTVSER